MLKTILAFFARVKDEVFADQTERIRTKHQPRINYENTHVERCIRMQELARESAARPGIGPASYAHLMQIIEDFKMAEEEHRVKLFQARKDLEHELRLESIVSMPLTGCPRAAMARHLNRF